MARKRNRSQAPAKLPVSNPDTPVLERVQELTWALLDEEITDDEFSLLDTLLLSDDEARKCYIECIQLHTDLMAHYAQPADQAAASSAGKSPVLGFLNADVPPIGLQSPQSEDV
jgi:hypothetical protein